MNTIPAVDLWAPILPVPEVMAHISEHFPKQMLGYVRVFWKREPVMEEVRAHAKSFQIPESAIMTALDDANITKTLITGFDEGSVAGEVFIPNELVAGLCERHPQRFIPFAGIDIFSGVEGLRALERWIKERRFRGLSLRPFMIGLPADDKRYYPFYAKCVELNIPLSIHTSANWTTVAVNDLGHPRHLDPVAADFPELKIIISHAGYPWVLEAVLLAWKYPNVYLELAAHRPKYMAMTGTGWEPLFRFGTTTIQDKVLYGTGWFLMGRPPADIVNEFRALPVKPDVMEKWLHKNAEKLFCME